MGSNTWFFRRFIISDVMGEKLAQNVVLVINHRSKVNLKKFTWAHEIYFIPDDIVHFFEEKSQQVLDNARNIARAHSHVLFLIAAGPLSEVLIYHMWEANKCNQYFGKLNLLTLRCWIKN